MKFKASWLCETLSSKKPTTKGPLASLMQQGLFPTLASGTFQHSGSKGGSLGNTERKEKRDGGRERKREGGVKYTPKGGEERRACITKLSSQCRKTKLQKTELCGSEGESGTTERHCQFLSAHIVFIS